MLSGIGFWHILFFRLVEAGTSGSLGSQDLVFPASTASTLKQTQTKQRRKLYTSHCKYLEKKIASYRKLQLSCPVSEFVLPSSPAGAGRLRLGLPISFYASYANRNLYIYRTRSHLMFCSVLFTSEIHLSQRPNRFHEKNIRELQILASPSRRRCGCVPCAKLERPAKISKPSLIKIATPIALINATPWLSK